jgi:hypothetical protein
MAHSSASTSEIQQAIGESHEAKRQYLRMKSEELNLSNFEN